MPYTYTDIPFFTVSFFCYILVVIIVKMFSFVLVCFLIFDSIITISTDIFQPCHFLLWDCFFFCCCASWLAVAPLPLVYVPSQIVFVAVLNRNDGSLFNIMILPSSTNVESRHFLIGFDALWGHRSSPIHSLYCVTRLDTAWQWRWAEQRTERKKKEQ